MSSIIFDESLGVDREEFRRQMKAEGVDTRPFFYPISAFPMFKEQKTPVAHHIAAQGVNLPSGLMLTKSEVDFVCARVKKVLQKLV